MSRSTGAQGTDPVSWAVAERVASQLLRFVPPLEPATVAALEVDFATATARAERLVEEATGLVSPAPAPRGQVTDRAGWVRANIASFRRLLRPVGERLAAGPPAARRALSPANTTLAGVEVGVLLAWMSGRVLGQYDLLPVDGDAQSTGGALYYVGPNVAAIERRYGFAPEQFRLWLALHEVTHRAQFTAVPWMRAHFVGLVERGMAVAAPDGRAVLDSLLRAAAEVRAGRNPLAEAGLIGLLASADQLAALRDAQALMSLLEGHGDVVMSRAATEAIPDAPRFARTLAERRTSAPWAVRVAQQVLGVEAKLRQYREGERFVEAVEQVGGAELFALVWSSPAMLPSLEEIRDPERWLARVGGVPAGRA